ncbi:hypothetical protein E2320_004419 [Naja naja]|nr:hypothetical protein E2320_004419 [Naja naja]
MTNSGLVWPIYHGKEMAVDRRNRLQAQSDDQANLLYFRYGGLGDHGCAYVQNDSLRSQPCGDVAKSICETTVQFGWSI